MFSTRIDISPEFKKDFLKPNTQLNFRNAFITEKKKKGQTTGM